jgi:hypothetical protein
LLNHSVITKPLRRRLSRPLSKCSAFFRVVEELANPGSQSYYVTWVNDISVLLMSDVFRWTAGGRRDYGQPHGRRLDQHISGCFIDRCEDEHVRSFEITGNVVT